MEDSRSGFERAFELLQSGDADGLRRILQQDPAHSEARDSTGISLLMHSLYRGRRDLAELIATNERRSIFSKRPRSAVSIASSGAFAMTRPLSTPVQKMVSPPCTSPVSSASPKPPVC